MSWDGSLLLIQAREVSDGGGGVNRGMESSKTGGSVRKYIYVGTDVTRPFT